MQAEGDPAPLKLVWSGHTDPGKKRVNNEDTFLCLQFNANEVRYLGKVGDCETDEWDFVFAVGDGMGGANAGEFASRIAVDKITALLPKTFKQSASGFHTDFEDLLCELFQNIHDELEKLGQAYSECRGMGTTLSLCWLTPGYMYFAHIGDSRIYYLPADSGMLRQITDDHSHVGWLQRQGKISEREAKQHPRRSSLQKALGSGHKFVEPQLGAIELCPDDQFIICSDGVSEGLYDRQLSRLIQDPEEHEAAQQPAVRLVNAAVNISGDDNTTAIVIESH